MKLTNDEYKMIFGIALLIIIAGLASIIAIGNVKQESSFGLDIVLGSLTTLAGGFATWAFSKIDNNKP